MVLEVSAVVAVVMVVVAAAPTARLQPPKVYPVLVVGAVLASDAVESARVSPIRFAVSVGGKELARVLPLKIIVGAEAMVARAGAPKPKTPETARAIIAEMAIGLFSISDFCILTPLLKLFFESSQQPAQALRNQAAC
jgi:hypothetical protein